MKGRPLKMTRIRSSGTESRLTLKQKILNFNLLIVTRYLRIFFCLRIFWFGTEVFGVK